MDSKKNKDFEEDVPVGYPSWEEEGSFNPVIGLETIKNTMNQLIADIFYQAGAPFEVPWQPKIDMYSDEKNLYIDVELSGASKEDIKVHATPDLIIVQGCIEPSPKISKSTCFVKERFSGKFSRSIPLPYHISPELITAKMRRGVLSISIPLPSKKGTIGKKIEIE